MGRAVKNSLEIIIKQARLEGGFERGGRIRAAECWRLIVPDRWASIRKRSFTKCFHQVSVWKPLCDYDAYEQSGFARTHTHAHPLACTHIWAFALSYIQCTHTHTHTHEHIRTGRCARTILETLICIWLSWANSIIFFRTIVYVYTEKVLTPEPKEKRQINHLLECSVNISPVCKRQIGNSHNYSKRRF